MCPSWEAGALTYCRSIHIDPDCHFLLLLIFSCQIFFGHGLPGCGLPGRNLPGRDLPGRDLPGHELPGRGLPGQGMPGGDLPGRGLPWRNLTKQKSCLGVTCKVLIFTA